MSQLSTRDKLLLLIAATVIFYGFLVLMFKRQQQEWQTAQRGLKTAEDRVEMQKQVIASRGMWQKRYDDLRDLIPVFSPNQSTDTHWLQIMDSIAQENNVRISRRSIGKETEVGEVTEITLNCPDWEANLESLVKFIYSLERHAKTMIDVRQLYIRTHPQSPGMLRGNFTINCAYMREG